MCSALRAVSTGGPLSYYSSSAYELGSNDFVAGYGHDRWLTRRIASADHTLRPRQYEAYNNLVDLVRHDGYSSVQTRRRIP